MASASLLYNNTNKIKKINSKSYAIINLKNKTKEVKINETLPFRIRFKNIRIEGYSMSNPAPIGIAVIGFSNYIL